VTDPQQFRVELTHPRDELALLALAGEIDLYSGPQFHKVLLHAIGQDVRHVIVDFSAVSFIDSTALGILVAAAKRFRQDEGVLLIVCGPGNVRGLLQIAGMAQVFMICATLEESLATAQPTSPA
jgi:anti-sigma B factor antagonist